MLATRESLQQTDGCVWLSRWSSAQILKGRGFKIGMGRRISKANRNYIEVEGQSSRKKIGFIVSKILCGTENCQCL
jgi:hypothetical protein